MGCEDVVRFGPFVLDLESGELKGNQRTERLHDKPFEALLLLLEHAGEVVTREQFRQRLWPSHVFVDFENNQGSSSIVTSNSNGDNDAQAPSGRSP